ncbi:polysaccharide biosynthesis tyrosine autokinase [Deinococcus aquatilis]|uniref:polysaccharide biosynthesis tyrosine autokinase n=1 Tax=Deinococcus aquatilis TaxID=519440 RepID=UPI000381DF23|nr:polysaccharide biosynthesis tyrosine autokinase [Deinococcus aquatilis]
MTQLPSQSESRSKSTDDIDLAQVFAVLRRQALPLLLAPVLVGGATYALFKRQAPTYEAVTSVMAAQNDNSNSVLSSASVTAPQLPQGAVEEVVHSRQSVERMIELLRTANLPDNIKTAISQQLNNELASDKFSRVTVKARLDTQQRGVYELRASAESPEAARVLASAATQALLDWDMSRARTGVGRARKNLQEQLKNISTRLAAVPAGSVEAQSLIAARGQLILNLSQATVFEEGAVGNLTLLAEANAPRSPVAPKPARNAVLAALLTLFAGAGLALLLDSLRRRVRSTADIIALDVPAIGELPRMSRARRADTAGAATAGVLYEPTGFIRVNLSTAVPHSPALLTVSSARPGEGKSTVVAAVAESYALAGKRVLVIDLDVHRPTQQEFWSVGGRPWVPLPGAEEGHQTTVVQAIEHPTLASAIDVGRGIHLLLAGEVGRRAASLLNTPGLPELLRQWATGYDVVLIDTPPLLSVADAFVIAPHTDGLVLVVESNETSVPEVQRVLQGARTSQVKLLGVVVNKVRRGQQGYGYSYSYAQGN